MNISFTLPPLTGCNVEISILAFILRMLRMLAGQIVTDALVLYGLVFPTESNIPVRVQRCHMLGKLIDWHCGAYLIANLHGNLPIYLRSIGMMWWIVQIVIGSMEALSAGSREAIRFLC